MSRTMCARHVVLVALSWGVVAVGVTTAGEPTLVRPGAPPRPVPTPGPGYYPRTPPGANELPPGYPPVDNSHSQRPLRDAVQFGRPLGCWASFNGYGCSSLRSELAFIFGSCRTFYGEPCLKGAPPSALPPWAGPESGYHGHPLKNENGPERHGLLDRLRKAGCPNCQ